MADAQAGSTRMRALAERFAYPSIIALSVAATWLTFERSGSVIAASLAGSATALVAVAVLERLLPYRQAWRRSHGDLHTDLLHMIFSSGVAHLISIGALAAIAVGSAHLAASVGATIWPTALPFVVQLALGLLLAELGYYWLHRGYHKVAWLWRLHAIHHSAPRMYWVNSYRNHPADFLLAILAMTGPLVLLGASEIVVSCVTVVAFAVMLLQHANAAMKLGWLNGVFVGGEVHRWHHSRVLDEQNRNFGGVLMVWDVVFGTFFYPKDREPPIDVGLHETPDFPTDYLGQLASPFRPRSLDATSD